MGNPDKKETWWGKDTLRHHMTEMISDISTPTQTTKNTYGYVSQKKKKHTPWKIVC